MSTSSHEAVVATFNVLGYDASFAAAAERMGNGTTAAELYATYASCDALAEAWLSELIPGVNKGASVRSLFAAVAGTLTAALRNYRDFSRGWLAAAPAGGWIDLRPWQLLHSHAHEYFVDGLTALRDQIALPPPLVMDDVVADVADALCAALAALLAMWQADRSTENADTDSAIDAVACLLDALLTRRADYLNNSLLVHLHRATALPREQLTKPLLDLLLPAGRVQRLGQAPALADLLRTLLPPHSPEVT
jgi:hypothetical protein